MNTIFKKSLLSVSVAMALGVAAPAYAAQDVTFSADVILFDRSGGTGTAADPEVISFDNMDFSPSTLLVQDAFRTVIDSADANANGSINFATEATFTHEVRPSFDVWTQGKLGVFDASVGNIGKTDCASPPDCGALAGSEFTFQLGINMSLTGSASIGGETTLVQARESVADADSDGIVDGNHFFFIWYDAIADSNNLTGIGFGDDDLSAGGTAANTCDTTTLNTEADDGSVLILCGTVFFADLTMTRTGAGGSRLDASGADNYPAIGTQTLGAGFGYQVDVLYQNNAFFRSNVSSLSANILDGDDTNDFADGSGGGAILTPFGNTDPSANVVGESWTTDLGIDRVTVAGSPRIANNFICANAASATLTVALTPEDVICSAVEQFDATVSYQERGEAPEPAGLLLLGAGLGLLGVGSRKVRRLV